MIDATSPALMSTVFEASVDAMIVASHDGEIIRANASAARLFGYNGSALMGQSINDLMPAHMADKHDAFVQDYLKTGVDRIIGTRRPVEGLRRDGTSFALQISVSKAEYDGAIFFVAVMHDLSGNRATQQANSRSHRTDAIAHMSHGLSHDFNNLMTIIIGNLELALPKIDDAPTRSMIDDALEAAEHCADLTSRLSQFTRQAHLQPEVTDISTACLAAKTVLDQSVDAKYTLICSPTETSASVDVDPSQLQNAIMNLVMNARDAMPDGGDITISNVIKQIDDTAVGKRGTYVCVSVTDCGTGMSAAAQLRAFEPFYTTKPLSRAAGLGLSMVHGFAQQSHGFVEVCNNPERGSTVSIYLPASTCNTTTPKVTPTMSGRNHRVLVVEGNEGDRSVTCERIEALGYRTLCAGTADQALEVLNIGYKIDALLTDLITPDSRDGFDLVLLARSNFPNLRIILTTGHDRHAFNKNTLLISPFEVLPKLYSQEDLAACLHAAFARI